MGQGERGGGAGRGASAPRIQDDGRVSEHGCRDGDDMIHISWEQGVRRSQRVPDHSLDTGVRKYNTV